MGPSAEKYARMKERAEKAEARVAELEAGIRAIVADHCGENGTHDYALESVCDQLQMLLGTADSVSTEQKDP